MIDGQGVVLISYSERFRVQLAQPVAQGLLTQGLRPVLIGEEPLPARVKSTPETKVNAYFAEAQMVVYFMTPDDRTQDGEIRTRQNIIDELRIGMEREHLKDKLMVFKADNVALPSNVNPVYDRLPLDDSQWVIDKIVQQAREWGLLAKEPSIGAPAPPTGGWSGRREAPGVRAAWPTGRWFPLAPHRTVHAVLPHTAHRRSSPSAFSVPIAMAG